MEFATENAIARNSDVLILVMPPYLHSGVVGSSRRGSQHLPGYVHASMKCTFGKLGH